VRRVGSTEIPSFQQLSELNSATEDGTPELNPADFDQMPIVFEKPASYYLLVT